MAEVVRSRRTSIRRAAEISRLVIRNIDSLKSEPQALAWVTEIEKDFEEVVSLKQALHFNFNASDVNVYEREVKEYASLMFQQDMVRSADFLKDASAHQATIQQLCVKYPDFCSYLMNTSDKAQLLQAAGQAAL